MLENIKKLLKEPAFWDIFGIIAFSFIAVVAFWSLSTEEPFSRPLRTIFVLIGLAGLLIDGRMVWERWIKKSG